MRSTFNPSKFKDKQILPNWQKLKWEFFFNQHTWFPEVFPAAQKYKLAQTDATMITTNFMISTAVGCSLCEKWLENEAANCRLMIHTIWFCLFSFQTSRKTSTFYQRNDAITYHEAFIYYLYQLDLNFVRVKDFYYGSSLSATFATDNNCS